MLPATTCSPTTRTSSAKSAKTTTASKSATAPAPAIPPASPTTPTAASPKNIRKKEPKENAAERSEKDNQEDDEEENDSPKRNMWPWLHALGRCTRLRVRQLDSRIRCDHVRNPDGYEQQRLTVIAVPHQRECFASKPSHLSIRQDRLQPITDLNPVTAILNCVQNQNTAVSLSWTDAPLCEQVNRILLYVPVVGGIDGHNGDLGIGFFVDLLAYVLHLRL